MTTPPSPTVAPATGRLGVLTVGAALPELPGPRLERLMRDHQLAFDDADLLTGDRALADRVYSSVPASLLGRLTRTGRTFLALFLFGLYVSTQIKSIPWWDVVGANGIANVHTVSVQLAVGVIACVIGYLYNQRKAST